MKISEIFYSSHFEKSFKRLERKLRIKALKKELVFREDCFDPSLKTHKLKGHLANYWSFSIDRENRIMFSFESDGKVTFLDCGDHSIYK